MTCPNQTTSSDGYAEARRGASDGTLRRAETARRIGVAADRRVTPSGSLWRDRNFLTMWSGQALAQFGAQITELAIPVLAVLILGATEFEVGMLNAAGFAAFLVVGLPAGAWIDRMRKRHVMIWADAVRAVALATLPVLWWLGALEMWHLYAVAAHRRRCDGVLRCVVPEPHPVARSARRRSPRPTASCSRPYELANIAGPGIGGWLIGVLSAPFAILATAGDVRRLRWSRCCSRATTRSSGIPTTVRRSCTRSGRACASSSARSCCDGSSAPPATSNFFNTISMTMLPIFMLRDLGLSPATMGIIFSLGAVGGFLGAIATPHIVRRIGEARAIPISAIGFSVVGLLPAPAPRSCPRSRSGLIVASPSSPSFTVLLYNITQVTFRQRITPPRLLGRMNASVRFVVWGVMPIAALVSGALGTWIGVVTALWIGAIGQLLVVACSS